jgi:hypothetical protein
MFPYVAYGLNVLSDLPLPELLAGKAGADVDVVIRHAKVNRLPTIGEPSQGCFHATPDEAFFFWEEDGLYLVRGGREIIIDPSPHADEHLLRLAILGIAFGALLHQRGLLTLHASAVANNGGAIAFLGDKGAGKSIMAAVLHARGHDMMADDIVALDLGSTGDPMVLPGYPQLKLWWDAIAYLGDETEAWPRLHRQLEEKRSHRLLHGFSRVPLPLRHIYILAEGPCPAIEGLHTQEIFVELVRHSYALRFLGNPGATRLHFRQCVRLAGTVPIYRLKRPRSLAGLSDVARLVEEHLASNSEQLPKASPIWTAVR